MNNGNHDELASGEPQAKDKKPKLPSEEIQIRSCGVLIWRELPTRSILLMKHSSRWDIPKGHVDPGETELQCAYRELWEETGISMEQVQLDPDFCFRHQYMVSKNRYGKEPKLKELVVFLGQLLTPVEIQVTEHQGFEWLDWNPPHQIQKKTIDPLLEELQQFWAPNE